MEEKNFDIVFTKIEDHIVERINRSTRAKLLIGDTLADVSGTLSFEVDIDSFGNGFFETHRYGAGRTIYFSVSVISPIDSLIKYVIYSSDGGGFKGCVTTGEVFAFQILTNFSIATTVSVRVKCTATDCKVIAIMNYAY